ncbi:MAG: DUF2460 domain-containing protein [Roseiarcus sp.]
MTNLVFPTLAGQGWSVHKKPTWSTIVASHVSGREVRDQLWMNPIWEFELTFNGLDGTSNGAYGGLGAQSMQALMGFFLQCGGQAQSFIYYDSTDYQVTAQNFGTGDGSTTSFQLTRSLGGFSEWIVAPVTESSKSLYFQGFTVTATAPLIYEAGSLVSSSNYSLDNGLVTFTTAPASGAALTWAGYFGFACRFDADTLDFEQPMTNLWKVESVKFRSLRAQ